MRQQDRAVTDDLRVIYPEYFERGKNLRYFFPGSDPGASVQQYLDPERLALSTEKRHPGSQFEGVPVRVWNYFSGGQVGKDTQRCPACETDFALTLVGSQAASLSSVVISHLYQSPFNRDKKLLAFTDSVQDASHRAGFFGAPPSRPCWRPSRPASSGWTSSPTACWPIGARGWTCPGWWPPSCRPTCGTCPNTGSSCRSRPTRTRRSSGR